MDTANEFNQKETAGERPGNQFRIEVAQDHQGRNFTIRPLGHDRFEIADEEGSIGTIQLDEADHARCESQGCELDLPLLQAIRDQIQFHYEWKKGDLQ